MSKNPAPYAPNFPSSQNYEMPDPKENEKSPMLYPSAYPGMNASQPVVGQPTAPSHPAGYPPSYSPQPQYPPVSQPQHGLQQAGYPQPGYPVPVVQQPVAQMPPGGWMTIPQRPANCPPGLEYLTMIDQLLVHQKVELLEAFVGFETNNKYTIKNNLGQKVYYAVEENDCCTRNCLGSIRPFEMKILDNYMNEIIHLKRPLACDSCCCPCCLQNIEVSAPFGTTIGYIQQNWSLFKPQFSVLDATGDEVLQIKGPMCTFSCGGDVKFHVYTKSGEVKIGCIKKQWSGLAREFFTDSDFFGISFPMDLDVRIKAVLLGACFLIDFMFFEKSGKNNSQNSFCFE